MSPDAVVGCIPPSKYACMRVDNLHHRSLGRAVRMGMHVKMEPTQSNPELGPVLLSFYECLTDPNQLDTLMEMLTSWLDDEGHDVISPKIDYHADRAWRLLGEISEPEYRSIGVLEAEKQTHFESKTDIEVAIRDQIRPEDVERLRNWLSSETETDALLLRVVEAEATELVILSFEPKHGAYLAKWTGPEFQTLISKFVADSFGLTNAEFTLVKELLCGGTLREIADRLGKSWETTRSQVKTLTNKLGVNTQADILRTANQMATLMPPRQPEVTSADNSKVRRLRRPDGRTIVYEVDGPSSDKTLIYLHGMTQGRHWPEKARRIARKRGWQVVRISRAGRGQSSVNVKENEALLQDHVNDVMAILNHEGIGTFSIFGAADGFAVGYPIALQHPERVKMIIGLEVVPPILSRKVISGFSGKMKTFGLACLYAPKSVKFMLGIAMRQLEQMEDRYSGVHPLLGVELGKLEDADGIRADDQNFQDLMVHKADGMWRDASYSAFDWAFAADNSNLRPRAALIHCDNSLIKSDGHLDNFAQRIGAPIYRLESYFPYVSASLPLVLDKLDPI